MRKKTFGLLHPYISKIRAVKNTTENNYTYGNKTQKKLRINVKLLNIIVRQMKATDHF